MDSIDKIKIHNKSHISDCCIITLDRHHHANGNLTAINNGVELPFDLQRTFYMCQAEPSEAATATTRATSSSSPSAAALT